jgi:two-component system LytT family sensor kinase
VDQKLILVTLLIKLGVAAAVSAALVRAREFHTRLFHDEGRTLRDTTILVIATSIPYGLGVQVRHLVKNFAAADLSFEGCILLGVIGGPYAGVLGGVLMALPAMLHGEYITLPFNVFVGLVAGGLGMVARREDIWSFSPFIDLTIFRWIKRNIPRPQMDWQITFFVVIVVMQGVRIELGRLFPGELFYLYSPDYWVLLLIVLTSVTCVAIALKIWNNTRIELKLEEQTRLLLQSRLDALQSQINPHFLFNTLNSVSSLIRMDPEVARELILKLSNILRSLLRKHDAFSQLREEVAFIDDYLDIETIRFGKEKLHVEKDLDAETLDHIVPSMLLQPLVENAIKHGLEPKVDGGRITLRSRLLNNRLIIEVQDDGVGIAEDTVVPVPAPDDPDDPAAWRSGVGLRNVAERLRVLYGDEGKMTVSVPGDGKGTRISLELPLVHTDMPDTAADLIYTERSRTRA